MNDPRTATGRSRETPGWLDPARAAALHATLDLPGPASGEGEPLPPFWHWIYFWEAEPPSALGRDGHPRPGGFIPDTALPRRMWAGGRLEWQAPLKLGTVATRRSTILAVEPKAGRSGPLCFVRVRHEIAGPDGAALTEDQDLVYREDPAPGSTPPPTRPAPRDESLCETRRADTIELFRYSALTFNGHRIHYDLAYARETEGYPGLVVHGPLLAQRLILCAARALPGLRRFRFQAIAPIFHFESFDICARPSDTGLALWIRGADGRLAMSAEAE